jgi:hypothetical protein
LLSAALALGLTACGGVGGTNPNLPTDTTRSTNATNSTLGNDRTYGVNYGVDENGYPDTDYAQRTTRRAGTVTPGDRALTSLTTGQTATNGYPGTTRTSTDGKMLGLENFGAGAPLRSANVNGVNADNRATVTNRPGASYEQMLRNARVHDRDGYLLDGENAVTRQAANR